MKVAFFGARSYDVESFEAANAGNAFGVSLKFFEPRLTLESVGMAAGYPAACIFVNDVADRAVLQALAQGGTRLLALRCAGFNHVDLPAARDHRITVVRVPAYSPHATAEHAVALILALNRKLHRAYNRVRESNFSLEGLLGFDLNGKTVGVIGTGRIGVLVCRILAGFGCRLLAYDVHRNPDCEALGARYVPLTELYAQSDILTLHCPLTPQSRHMIDTEAIRRMKRGVMIINTSRGGLIDTRKVIAGLKSGQVGSLGLDVYEEEGDLFYEDQSDQVLADDVFARLLTFPNVLITGHQAFFTREALDNIARTTLDNIRCFAAGEPLPNQVAYAP